MDYTFQYSVVDELKQKIKGKMRYADILLSVETIELIIKALEKEPCSNCIGFKRYAKQMGFEIEQEPCEKTQDDTISRQAVLDLATTIETDDSSGNEILEVVEVNDIKNIPPVTPQEPKTGKWTNGSPICPCCGEDKFKDLDADIWADWQPKYCPNCGAKMQEIKE